MEKLFDFIEYLPDWNSLEKEITRMPVLKMDYSNLLTQFGFCKLQIFQNNMINPSIVIEEVDILGFSLELPYILQNLKQNIYDVEYLDSMDQYYQLKIEKVGNECFILDTFKDISISLDFVTFMKYSKKFKAKVFNDFITHFPILMQHKDYDRMRKDFTQ